MNARGELQTSGNSSVQTTPFVFYYDVLDRLGLANRPPQRTIFVDLERQMRDFQAEHDSALQDVRRNYVLPPDTSVVTFLSEHRTLPQILLEAAAHLRDSFGAGIVFKLRAPIDESGSSILYAVAMCPGPVADVRAALDRFDEDWWIAHSPQAGGRLSFTYELL
jgi:hypothetical protein